MHISYNYIYHIDTPMFAPQLPPPYRPRWPPRRSCRGGSDAPRSAGCQKRPSACRKSMGNGCFMMFLGYIYICMIYIYIIVYIILYYIYIYLYIGKFIWKSRNGGVFLKCMGYSGGISWEFNGILPDFNDLFVVFSWERNPPEIEQVLT